MSFSPIIRVRKLLDKMKSERGDQKSPRLQNKRFHSRTPTSDLTPSSSPNTRPKKTAKSYRSTTLSQSVELTYETKEEQGEDQFMYLPIEATLLIFSFLEKEDLERIGLVSKLWNDLANDEVLWKLLCIEDWNVDCAHEKSWKRTYYRLEDILSDGIWEGMSKWIEPVGFDNEQRTTARLNFQKRTSRLQRNKSLNSGSSTPISSPSLSSKAEIHRCASTTNPSQLTMSALDNNSTSNLTTTTTTTPITSSTSSNAVTNASSTITATTTSNNNNNSKEADFKVFGSGVTINCAAPSPFKIEGERVSSDTSGCTFQWSKLFERHTSVYSGKINFVEGTVTGTITYNDGTTHWRGEFQYKKVNRMNNNSNKKMINYFA